MVEKPTIFFWTSGSTEMLQKTGTTWSMKNKKQSSLILLEKKLIKTIKWNFKRIPNYGASCLVKQGIC